MSEYYVLNPAPTLYDAAAPLVLAHVSSSKILTAALDEVNTRLKNAGSGWKLASEPGSSHTIAIPVKFGRTTYDLAPGNYPERAFDNLLDLLGRQFSVDPVLVGAPAYKPCGLTIGDFGRVPVAMMADAPPPRRSLLELPIRRRPIVALLDTAVDPNHPWLGPPGRDLAGDEFWIDARDLGWDPGERLDRPGAYTKDTLDRELFDQEGHGTFSAGIIRQVGPDARVLAVHVMNDDGLAYADHVLNALGWLDASNVVGEGDVVCVPVSFRPTYPQHLTYLDWLGDVLGRLGNKGVLVVAAAGNDGQSDREYPAAFATADRRPRVPLVSVGACNTNRQTRAHFSNYGDWVTAHEVGVSCVSTFPRIDGANQPELVKDGDRETADSDDFRGGFARWSGTSFAAAAFAARRAQGYLDGMSPAATDAQA